MAEDAYRPMRIWMNIRIFLRKIRHINLVRALLIALCVIFVTVTFCAEGAKLIEKIHISATVIIAAAVCWIQYSSYQEKRTKGREKELMNFCKKIVSSVHFEERNNIGNITVESKKDGEIIESIGNKRISIYWDYHYVALEEKGGLTVTMMVLRGKSDEYFRNYFPRIMYIETPVTRFIFCRRCYRDSSKISEDKIFEEHVLINSFTDREWTELMTALSYILHSLTLDGVR